jgi:Kef-type K+ transport system membrane component KefB
MAHGASVAVFIAQLVVLLIVGRLLGELMQRIRQPPVIGQIVTGVLLGPSVLGALAPPLSHALFPASEQQQAMLDAVAQLGIVLLLLITGMETDLSVFRNARRPLISISLGGIVVPFICGCLLGISLHRVAHGGCARPGADCLRVLTSTSFVPVAGSADLATDLDA